MEDKFKKIYDKVVDIIFSIMGKFDKISEKIFEQTGKKINVGAIVIAFFAVIVFGIAIKSILAWLWSLL